MTEYGLIYDNNEIKKQLIDANRDYYGRKTWENLYGSINAGEKQQIGALAQNYATAVADAYSAAYRTNQAIASSNLGEGYKLPAMDETDLALEQAYESYRQNYLEGKSEIQSAAAEATTAVNTALEEQAKYTAEFAQAPYEYLQYAFDKYAEGEDADNIFLTDELWKRYTYVDKDTGETLLKPWEDIAAYGAYDQYTDEFGNVQKEWTGLFDESGNLTIKGADFYDQMLNQLAYEGENLTFGSWLAENKNDLYNWSQSYNPYDYTEAGTNVGSFKTMVGLTSTDEQYQFIERFGGMTRNELDTMFNDFVSKTTSKPTLKNVTVGKAPGSIKAYEDIATNLVELTDQLGITDLIESESGISLSDLPKYMSELESMRVSEGDAIANSVVGGLAAGGGTVALLHGGPVGWLIGGGVAIGTAISNYNSTKKRNKQLYNEAKKQYTDLVTKLVEFAHENQRKVQSDFYAKNK